MKAKTRRRLELAIYAAKCLAVGAALALLWSIASDLALLVKVNVYILQGLSELTQDFSKLN